jgi:hypothetical protein
MKAHGHTQFQTKEACLSLSSHQGVVNERRDGHTVSLYSAGNHEQRLTQYSEKKIMKATLLPTCGQRRVL